MCCCHNGPRLFNTGPKIFLQKLCFLWSPTDQALPKVLPPFPATGTSVIWWVKNHQFYILPETSSTLKYRLLASFCVIFLKCSHLYLKVWMSKKTKRVSYYRFDPTSRLCVNTPMANTFWPSWKSITWRTVLIWGQLVDHQMGCCKRQREMEEKLNCELSKPTT